MTKLSGNKMALVDLEWTTDPHSEEAFVIELALIIMQSSDEGWSEKERFETLLKPDTSLCPRVSALTGITEAMLNEAPRFQDWLDHLRRLTQDCVFVAHGAAKDQWVWEQALKRMGVEINAPWVCTLERAREEWPDLNQYDLKSLSQMIGHHQRRSHRALDDVIALKEIFLRLVRAPRQWRELTKRELRDDLPQLQTRDYQTYQDLPERPGTYSFYQSNKLCFLGFAHNLRREIQRIALNSYPLPIDHLHLDVHPHELANICATHSLLGRFQPWLNKQRQQKCTWGLYTYRDQRGLLQLKLRKIDPHKRFPLEAFISKEAGLQRYQACLQTSHFERDLAHKTPTELQVVNQERKLAFDRLSLPFENARIALKSEPDEWVLIERGRLNRVKRKGKEIPLKETLEMRVDFLRQYREIKTRLDHPYEITLLKKPDYRAAPSAGRRSPPKIRTGTSDSSLRF